MKLTGKERFQRILNHQPVDRIGLFEVFWRETAQKWSAQGHFEKPEKISDHFGLDVRRTGHEITPVPRIPQSDRRSRRRRPDRRGNRHDETSAQRQRRDSSLAQGRSGAPDTSTSSSRTGAWEEHIRPHLLDGGTTAPPHSGPIGNAHNCAGRTLLAGRGRRVRPMTPCAATSIC